MVNLYLLSCRLIPALYQFRHGSCKFFALPGRALDLSSGVCKVLLGCGCTFSGLLLTLLGLGQLGGLDRSFLRQGRKVAPQLGLLLPSLLNPAANIRKLLSSAGGGLLCRCCRFLDRSQALLGLLKLQLNIGETSSSPLSRTCNFGGSLVGRMPDLIK